MKIREHLHPDGFRLLAACYTLMALPSSGCHITCAGKLTSRTRRRKKTETTPSSIDNHYRCTLFVILTFIHSKYLNEPILSAHHGTARHGAARLNSSNPSSLQPIGPTQSIPPTPLFTLISHSTVRTALNYRVSKPVHEPTIRIHPTRQTPPLPQSPPLHEVLHAAHTPLQVRMTILFSNS